MGRFLVEAEEVAGGVTEVGDELGGVEAEGANDLAGEGFDGGEGVADIVDHDVDEEAGIGGCLLVQGEGAADLAICVIKGGGAIAAGAHGPSKDGSVEGGRLCEVGAGELNVTDFAVFADVVHALSQRRPS